MEKERQNNAKAHKEHFPEMQEIKEDAIVLARNIGDVATHKAQDATKYVQGQFDELKSTGEDSLKKVESRIKAKPGQSIAIAFTAGLLASYLLGRR